MECDMTLDMTGRHRWTTEPHYRRYLAADGRITAVCVQDFDYPDYDASRFVDGRAFDEQAEAETAAVAITDVVAAGAVCARQGDHVGAVQAAQIVDAIIRWQPQRPNVTYFAGIVHDYADGGAR